MRNILDGIMNASCIAEIEVNVFIWLSNVPSCPSEFGVYTAHNEAPLMQIDKSIADLAS